MKQLFFGIFMIAISFSYAIAQKSVINESINDYQEGNYQKALEKLSSALKYTGDVKPDLAAKGWLYKGKCITEIIREAAISKDMSTLEKYEHGYLEAFSSFDNAAKANPGGKHMAEINEEIGKIYPYLLQMGMTYLTSQQYADALNYMKVSVNANEGYVQKDVYMAYDFRAQAHLGLKDSTQALIDFEKTIEAYLKDKPEVPDLYIGYTLYRIALIQRYKQNDIDATLNSIQKGIELTDTEIARAKSNTNLSSEVIQQLQERYNAVHQDLETFELDIYLNYPEKYAEALVKFEKAIAEDPNNTNVLLAYASLLEKSDEDKAIATYKKALTLNENSGLANFNLGALYVNKAVDLMKKANEMDDFGKAEELMKEADALFLQALPYMEKAHETSPKDRIILGSLKQITIQLNMTEKYKYYKQIESEL